MVQSEAILAQNRKASHDYFIKETFLAGIQLVGCEVKSIRNRECSLADAYISVENNEVYIKQMHVKPYGKQFNFNKEDPYRQRKLLLDKSEIRKLIGASAEKGVTIIPLNIKTVGRYVKITIALAQGKHNYDKRQAIAKRDANRQMERAIKSFNA